MQANNMIQELLEKRDLLFDIAVELYGELWVAEEKFWGSPTEIEMREINSQLLDLGYEEDIDDDIRAIGLIVGQGLVDKGIIPSFEDDLDDIPRWWEEDDDE